MAATVVVAQYTGAIPGASTDVNSASVTAGTSDEASNASSIPIPGSGSNHSFWTTTALVATAAPDNALNNLNWYTDGTNSFGTGVTGIVITASAYVQGLGTAGSSGALLDSACHGGLSGCDGAATSDMFLYTSGCKMTITGSIGATTGSVGDKFVVQQLSVISTAGAGNTVEETMTFEFDET
jgi:hypothetical protein